MTRKLGTVAATLAAALLVSTSAHAVLINAKGTGINYTLTEADTASPLTDQFTLTITGINGATDTEGGRTGVDAIAFNPPTGFVSATMVQPATGFVTISGGLNSTGCDGSGNFFCFDNTAIDQHTNPQIVPTTPFAANTTLTFVFDITTATGNFTGYNPSFKINWVGDKNNYNLISLPIGITPGGGPFCANPPCNAVPEPGSLAALGTGLTATAMWFWYRRRPEDTDEA